MFQKRSILLAALFATTVSFVACAPAGDKPVQIRQNGGGSGCPIYYAAVSRIQYRETEIQGAAIGNNPWRWVYISEDPKILMTQPVVPSAGWSQASTYYDYAPPPTQVSGSERPSRTSCTDGWRYRRWEWRVDVSEIPIPTLYNQLVGTASYGASGFTGALNLTSGLPGGGHNALLTGGNFVYQPDVADFAFVFYRPTVYLSSSSTRTPEGYNLFRVTDWTPDASFEMWGRDAFPYWEQASTGSCPTSLGFYRTNPATDPRWREVRATYRVGCYTRPVAAEVQGSYPWDANARLSQGNMWRDSSGTGIQAGIHRMPNGCMVCTIN